VINRIILFLGIAIVISACGVEKIVIKNYEGPDRPADQVALLKPQLYIIIHSIDGDKSKYFKTWQQHGSTDADMALAPGIHSFDVSYEKLSARSSRSVQIKHEFKEGRRYLLGAQLLGTTWKPQIQDVTDRPELWCITSPRC